MFIDGKPLDRWYETEQGVIWLTSLVEIANDHLILRDVLVYPTTSARAKVGVREMLQIFRSLDDEIRRQGFSGYTIHAERVYEDKAARMISISRRME